DASGSTGERSRRRSIPDCSVASRATMAGPGNSGSGAARGSVSVNASAVLIYNPHSGRHRGRRRAVLAMIDALNRRGLHVEARPSAAPGDATRLSREALQAGIDLIIAHGGDGSVNEVLQPLVGGMTPLAVWPRGTANVLGKELGLPRDIEGAANMIASGRTR